MNLKTSNKTGVKINLRTLKFLKIIFITICTIIPFIVIITLLPHTVQASNLQAKIFLKTQYPWNKKVPVVVAVKSSIDAQKLEVSFEPTELGSISPKKIVLNNIKNNTQYNVKFTFTPYKEGSGELIANVVLITQNNLYTQTYTKQIRVDSSRTVYPKSSSYIILQLAYLLIILLILAIIGFGLFKVYLYIKQDFLPRWIKEKSEDPI